MYSGGITAAEETEEGAAGEVGVGVVGEEAVETIGIVVCEELRCWQCLLEALTIEDWRYQGKCVNGESTPHCRNIQSATGQVCSQFGQSGQLYVRDLIRHLLLQASDTWNHDAVFDRYL